MAFIRKNLRLIGGQARAGVVPQAWTYTTPDITSDVKEEGYFPIDNSGGVGNNMRGNFRTNDWIMLTSENGLAMDIIFIDNDGSDGNDITTESLEINGS